MITQKTRRLPRVRGDELRSGCAAQTVEMHRCRTVQEHATGPGPRRSVLPVWMAMAFVPGMGADVATYRWQDQDGGVIDVNRPPARGEGETTVRSAQAGWDVDERFAR